MDALSSSSLSELFARDRAGHFSSLLFVTIFMTGMATDLEDSALISKWKACLSDGEEELLL